MVWYNLWTYRNECSRSDHPDTAWDELYAYLTLPLNITMSILPNVKANKSKWEDRILLTHIWGFQRFGRSSQVWRWFRCVAKTFMSRKKWRCIINIRINSFSSICCKALLNTQQLIEIGNNHPWDRFDCGQTGLRRRSMLIGSPCCSKFRLWTTKNLSLKRKYCEQGKQFTEELQHLVIFRSGVALLGHYFEET